MLKQQISTLLSSQKLNSISDIVYFVIQQVNKTLLQQPNEEIYLRLEELEKPKGLDVVMIQEVKTIVEAMIDQREENLRIDLQTTLNEYFQNVEKQFFQSNSNNRRQRQSLAQIEIGNVLNATSFYNNNQYQTRKNRQSQKQNRQSHKQNLSESLAKDNLMNDCIKLKQKLQSDRKQLSDLKHSLIDINREISNKISVEQTHKIVSEFESRMYSNIQNEKLELQKMQYKIKKQLQQEILKIKKQTYSTIDIQNTKKEVNLLRKGAEKLDRKAEKYKEQVKQVSKSIKSLLKLEQTFKKQSQVQMEKFKEYCSFNNLKNDDLNMILQEINKKLQYFQRIDLLQVKLRELVSNNEKGQWMTHCKTKNQSIIWEKQLVNSNSETFKFESQKSQILINESSVYLLEFILIESKVSHLNGTVFVQSLNLQNGKEIKLSGTNSIRTLLQVNQKSTISIKLSNGQSANSIGGKGILKISKH